MKNHYGYDSYRGNSRVRTFLKIVVVLLLIVLLVAVGAVFFLQRYKVYSADGLRLELPFLRREEDPSPSPMLPIVVVTPAPTAAPAPPSPTPVPRGLHAVPSTVESLSAADLMSVGADAAIFDMKRPDGTLGYVSDLQLAKELQTSAADPALNAALRAINAGDLYTIARVSCFMDNTAPYQNNKLALRTPVGNWRDPHDTRWMSPANADVQSYLCGVCSEVAALGFDEIVLDYAGYPNEGNLDYITPGEAYDKTRFTATLDAFYRQVRQALVPYPGVKLSIVGTETAVTDGADPLSGQTAVLLADCADRVWLPAPRRSTSDYVSALTGAGMKNSAENIMVRTADAAADSPGSWSAPDR
ncbi:MAG: putative glycoside hydrolase [Pseudoflavonifractor sp.]